ncbi:PIG-L deacetylase family protein [uncultured Erythrobacter sp.]|uniref:PIG-L deacetylase family protein n=1 Tax=uncultured Erythrobacter sp. TaxID=263913 RepID=UPI0026592F5F|nr:PIG-L family deacetylase [uncultured Erythrobacter sp.]
MLARSPWRGARWLVLAPHPDDETLGAGALIHHAAARNRLGGVVFLTDGSGSHPQGTPYLRAVRRREARRALGLLTEWPVPIDWLGWADGNPSHEASTAFGRSARRLGTMIRNRRIDALAVSDPGDRHCDHVAAFQLALAARVQSRRALQIFTYSVWHDLACRGTRFATPTMPSGVRRRALSAHRSQLTPSMGEGFRLPDSMRRMAPADQLIAVDWPR